MKHALLLLLALLGGVVEAKAQEVRVEGGVAMASTLGYSPGPMLKADVIVGGYEGPVLEASGWFDGSSKWFVGQGWSVNQRTTLSWLHRGFGPMVGVGFRRFGGPWTKDYAWWMVGIARRQRAFDWSLNYRGEIAASYNNHEGIVEAVLRSNLGKKVSFGAQYNIVHFYDSWPSTPARWGLAGEILVGYRIRVDE